LLSGRSYNHSGQVLYASADDDDAVHRLGAAGGLDRIGDNFAGDERVLHPLSAHRDAVGGGDSAEDLRHRAGLLDGGFSAFGQAVEAEVAGCDGAVSVSNADDGFGEVGIGEADGAEHGAVGGALDALGDDAAANIL